MFSSHGIWNTIKLFVPSVVATFIKVYTTTIKCNDKLWQVVGTITCYLKAIVPCMKSNACNITINTKLIGLVFNIFDRRGYGILCDTNIRK